MIGLASMYRTAFAIFALMTVVVSAQPAFEAKVPFVSARGAQKEYRDAAVLFDDSGRRLTIIPKKSARMEFDYDSVTKVYVEQNLRIGYSIGAAFTGFAIGGGLFGGKIAEAISSPNKMDLTLYIETKGPDGTAAPVILSVDKDHSTAALKQLDATFGNRVALVGFSTPPEKAETVDLGPRHLIRGNPTERPTPEKRPDKALVLVACPTGTGLEAVRTDKYQKWGGYILMDGKIVALNAPGTYCFFYLDPGERTLVSQVRSPGSAQHASAIHLELEPGKEYHLIQTIYIAGNFKSFLALHSKELVIQEIANLFWADWQSPAK